MNLLIVDDHPTNLKLLRAQLEAEGHVVFEAHDGVDALAALEREKVDVVISDILMPRMDGYRLCHEIRMHARLHDLPIIIYTATYTSPGDEKLALDVGADKYLKKPASVEHMIAALQAVIAMPHAARRPGALQQVEVLKEYSERLVNKLEEKNIALEQTNAELRATRGQLAHLLEHSPAVIYSLKVEGERVVPHVASENMSRLLGFTVEESSSYDWWVTHLHPEDRERAIAGVSETIKCGVLNTECRIQHKDGHYLWVEDNRRLVRDDEGKPTNIVGVWTDITERKQVQRQMLRAQRLESIGTLASGVAHDLNNALAPIMMATELLRLEFPDTASHYIELIQGGAKRGADMVKQLLTFAKGVEGERLLLQPRHLLKEMEKLIRSTFPKNIRLQTSYANNLPTILGDSTQLHQVLLNLCVNSRDAMPNGGTLTLKAENREIDTVYASAVPDARPGRYVVWQVMDTGTGIPPEILDRIFEPFFTTKEPDKGTGLGLSTVIGIVKSHGGFVRVYSTPGQGSTFAVYLPAAASGAPDTSLLTKADLTFRGNGESILVVDDEATVRDITRAVLTALNFKVLSAGDGTAALLQMEENRAALRAVITDLHMPGMDGLAFVRVLKSRSPQTSIIVTSGRLEEREVNDFKKLGVNALLEKPFTQEKLVAALKTILEK
jgi:PAS domain S-box-containing protein